MSLPDLPRKVSVVKDALATATTREELDRLMEELHEAEGFAEWYTHMNAAATVRRA